MSVCGLGTTSCLALAACCVSFVLADFFVFFVFDACVRVAQTTFTETDRKYPSFSQGPSVIIRVDGHGFNSSCIRLYASPTSLGVFCLCCFHGRGRPLCPWMIGVTGWVPVDEIRVVGDPLAVPTAGVSCFCTALWVGSGSSEMRWKDPHHP